MSKPVGRPRIPLQKRFESFVDRSGECWMWTGETDQNGYGVLLVTLGLNKRKLQRTHRLSWEIYRGPIPDGQCVLHKCDTPGCVRPDHLFLGTQAENLKDMWGKGRGRDAVETASHGEKSHMARVTAEIVIEIRRRYAAGENPSVIHKDMQIPISIHGVKAICGRRTWKHL